MRAALANSKGDTSRWPHADEFKRAWLGEAVYLGQLDAPRVKAVLTEIESGMRAARTEEPLPSGLENLDIDTLPTSWFEYWPLPDGTKVQSSEAGAVYLPFLSGEELSDRQLAIRRREEAKVTMGNLTLIHYGINRGLQN